MTARKVGESVTAALDVVTTAFTYPMGINLFSFINNCFVEFISPFVCWQLLPCHLHLTYIRYSFHTWHFQIMFLVDPLTVTLNFTSWGQATLQTRPVFKPELDVLFSL